MVRTLSGAVDGRILDECFASIIEDRPNLEGKLGRTRTLMEKAIPDALVTGCEGLAGQLVLPDENDRHVLAAAVRAGAQVIVTTNLRGFPPVASRPSKSRLCTRIRSSCT